MIRYRVINGGSGHNDYYRPLGRYSRYERKLVMRNMASPSGLQYHALAESQTIVRARKDRWGGESLPYSTQILDFCRKEGIAVPSTVTADVFENGRFYTALIVTFSTENDALMFKLLWMSN